MTSEPPLRPARRTVAPDDRVLVQALRGGDERAFAEIVERWSGMMLRVALSRVETRAVAEEVVQDAWLTVLRRLDRFEGRSSLRTWVVGIVVNLARSRARGERRSEPYRPERASSVDQARFLPPAAPRWPGHWAVPPVSWPEEELLAGEMRRVILEAIAALPPAQREVLVLRDLEDVAAQDACTILGVADANQRVLLHRARSRVRRAIEGYFETAERA
jgi:RNA polymerase sigma-70 factor (ECF subfamily)